MWAAGDPERVHIVRGPARDRFGDPVVTAQMDITELEGCLIAPGGSSENTTGANQVTADLTIYAPPAVDVVATDRIVARGQQFEVIGDPQHWGVNGTVIALRRIAG